MGGGDDALQRDLYNLRYLLGDKWAPAIMAALSDGPLRRVEIRSRINSYSIGKEWSDKNMVLHDSILTRNLKRMTEWGLLVRTSIAEPFPPKVFYALTPEVQDYLSRTEPIRRWAREHAHLIARAQAHNRGDGDDDPGSR